MICAYHNTCTKNCTKNTCAKRPSEILMDWCEEMKTYLIYKAKSERKEKLAKLNKLK